MTSKEYNELCDRLLEIERAQKARRAEIERLRTEAATFIKRKAEVRAALGITQIALKAIERHKEGR
jgi:hypothetical protein